MKERGCRSTFRSEDLHGFVFTPNSQTAAITVTPTSLNIGNQVVNVKSAAKSVTVKNSGTAKLDLNSVTPSADFVISATTCGSTLAAGKTCKVSVTFTPPQLGKLTGSIQFSDNAPNRPQSVPLAGTGVQPAPVNPVSATFAKQNDERGEDLYASEQSNEHARQRRDLDNW
jgi:Abnormal spindle-like microcephaly-assoc'd, ASPM-SPD-2-Hydin